MKIFPKLVGFAAALVLPSLVLAAVNGSDSFPTDLSDYRNVVPLRISSETFASTFGMTVTRALGNRPTLQKGGSYLITGNFHVDPELRAKVDSSWTSAQLGAFRTALIDHGAGRYALILTINGQGQVSIDSFRVTAAPVHVASGGPASFIRALLMMDTDDIPGPDYRGFSNWTRQYPPDMGGHSNPPITGWAPPIASSAQSMSSRGSK